MANHNLQKNQTSSTTTRSAANQSAGANCISLAAPAQLKLAEGASYRSKKSEDYFSGPKIKNSVGQTKVGVSYAVLAHYGKTRTKLLSIDKENMEFWVQQRDNNEDAIYYEQVAPSLYKKSHDDPNVDGDDRKRMLDSELSMFELPSNWQAMPDDPQPFEAQQGYLTDCSLIGSLSGIANSPHYSKKMKKDFDDTNSKKKLRLYHPYPPVNRKSFSKLDEFKPQESKTSYDIEVDMIFPIEGGYTTKDNTEVPGSFLYAQKDENVFANIKNGQKQPVWPMVYESGFAKHLGNDYTKLDDREVEDDLSILTGIEPLVYNNSEIDTHWDEFVKIMSEEGVVTGTTYKEKTMSSNYDEDFPLDHVFTFITIANDKAEIYNQYEAKTIPITKQKASQIFSKISVILKK